MHCRDCGKVMTEVQVNQYRLWGGEPQRTDDRTEGLCTDCLEIRLGNLEDPEDIIAEFCG